MKKVILTYGLIAGGIFCLMFLFMGIIGSSASIKGGMYIGYSTMILAFSMVFFGTKSYRDNVNNGTITFGRALGLGLLISLLASFIYSASWVVLQHFLMPDFYEKYVESMKASGATAQDLASMQGYMDIVKNPFGRFFLTLIEPLPAAILVPFISSLILKRKTAPAAR